MTTSLLLIGCGKMGGALRARWQETGMRLAVIDPQANEAYADLAALPASVHPDIVVFAVKPQQLPALLPAYQTRFGTAPLYLSIAAGKTTGFFRRALGDEARIVRAMPNTPALIGQGMTVLYGDASLPAQDRQMASQLMQAVGRVAWIENEALMDGVTALSGSGPAYVFLFLDALTQAGMAAGLPEALARSLALDTLTGSAALAAQSAESFAQLRQQVTSPGGTTEAALHVLMRDDGLSALIKEAVAAAAQKSKLLAE